MSWLGTAVIAAVAVPAAHVLARQPDQVTQLSLAFLLYAPGVAGLRAHRRHVAGDVLAGPARRWRGIGLVAGPLLQAAISVPLALLAPPRLVRRRRSRSARRWPCSRSRCRWCSQSGGSGAGRDRRPRPTRRWRGSRPAASASAVGVGVTLALPTGGKLVRGRGRRAGGAARPPRLRRVGLRPGPGQTCGWWPRGCAGSPDPGPRPALQAARASPDCGAKEGIGDTFCIMVDVHQRDMAVRPVEESDRPTVEWLTTHLWGAAEVAVHGGVYYPATLPGFIAERGGPHRRPGHLPAPAAASSRSSRSTPSTSTRASARCSSRRSGPRPSGRAATRSRSPPPTTTSARSASTSAAASGSPPSARGRWTGRGGASRRSPGPAISAFRCATKSTSPAPCEKEKQKR